MSAASEKVNFYGYDFLVTPDVLIPRPETEQLIDAVLNLAGVPYLPGVKPGENQLGRNPKILDVGTGSGCIAITLALKLPHAEILATDISKRALKVARKNLKNLSPDIKKHKPAFFPYQKKYTPNIKFLSSDLTKNIKNFTPDLIVANLPYVDRNWDWLDLEALSKEPEIALFAGDKGLKLIKNLIDEATNRKIRYLILEADPCQHQDIINYAKNYKLLETRGFILVLVSL